VAQHERFFSAHVDEIAVAATALMLNPDAWISCRSEQIDFLDERTLRRRVTVQFEVPDLDLPLLHSLPQPPTEAEDDYDDEAPPARQVFFAPIALLDKGYVPFLRVESAAGETLPILQREDNEALAACVLQKVAQAELGRDRAEALKADLAAVAGQEKAAVPEAARDSKVLGTLADELRCAFILATPLMDIGVGEQCVVSYTYERPAPFTRDLQATLGWRPTVYTADVPLLGMSSSYDIDLRVPDDVLVSAADVEPEEKGVSRAVHCRGSGAHLHVRGAPRGVQGGRATLELVPRWEGVLMAALLVTFANTLILGAGGVWTKEVNDADEVTAALLLGVPALLGAFLARPGEHRLVSRLLIGVRTLVAASVVLSLAGIAVVVHASGKSMGAEGKTAWWVLFAVSAVLTAIVAVGVIRSLRIESSKRERNESSGLHAKAAEGNLTPKSDIELTETLDLAKRMQRRP
jgi:hypothetical protein